MAQESIKEMKKSVKGNILIIMVIWVAVIIANVALGIVLQINQVNKNVESMLTDNLNGSYALVQKGITYLGGGDSDTLTPEALNTIIANNSCNTFILNSSGGVVASYMKSGTAQSSYKEYVQKAGQSTLYPKASGTKGSRMCYAAKAIENTGYTLLIGAPSAEYYGGLVTSLWVNGVLVVVMVVMCVFTNLIVTKVITSPLDKIRGKIIEMSHGNLSGARIDINTDDELGVLASSVNYLSDYTQNIIGDIHYTADEIANQNLCVQPKAQYNGDFLPVKNALDEIVTSMKEVVANIEAAGHEVSVGSAQMSLNSSALSQAADEGSATVQELNESLNSVHEQINHSAEKSAVARDMMEMSVTAINEGNEKMTKMLDAMQEINATSSQIANIIKTIQDISFQTNILSLNASIEAARAGEAGQGFAVVAGEVGELAGKTAEAAKSTTGLIETSLKAVEHGTVIANETAEMLGMIVNKAHESAEVVDELAHASTKQAESIQQSIEGMNRISASVAQVSTAAHECAESSTMLASQSVMLEDTVKKFVIDANDVRRVTASRPVTPQARPSEPIRTTAAPKPAAKIELPDDKPKAPAPKATASKPVSKLSKPAAAKIVLPDDDMNTQAPKPAAKPAAAPKPSPKPAQPSPQAASAAAPKARPVINLPDDNNNSAPAARAIKKATMQPVNRTVRMDPDKY